MAAEWARILAHYVPESANIHDRGSRLVRICRAQARLFAIKAHAAVSGSKSERVSKSKR
jgi:hypothetical protein